LLLLKYHLKEPFLKSRKKLLKKRKLRKNRRKREMNKLLIFQSCQWTFMYRIYSTLLWLCLKRILHSVLSKTI
jgi:hypothetical protein